MLSGSEALSQEAWPNPTTKILVDSDTNLNTWSALSQCKSVEQLRYEAAQLILEIERVISVQLSEILENDRFSTLEARWRGVRNVVWDVNKPKEIIIKVMDMSWVEISQDLNSQISVKNTFLQNQIGVRELDTLGGQPFGVVFIDHYLSLDMAQEFDDLYTAQLLCSLGEICACPIITSIAEDFFGEVDAGWKTKTIRINNILNSEDYIGWSDLRNHKSSRFLGLVLPEILMRTRYENLNIGFNFSQLPSQASGLWGNAGTEFLRSIIAEFERTAWFGYLKLIGPKRKLGAVLSEPCAPLPLGSVRRHVAKVRFTRGLGQFYSDQGFIPLCESLRSHDLYFVGNRSVHNCRGSGNLEVLTQIQTVLIACRMVHYLKIQVRFLIGKVTTASECEGRLIDWISQYCANMESASAEGLAQFPLKDAVVSVKTQDNTLDQLNCDISIVPQYQIDCVAGEINISTNLNARSD
jgi:type VI secretion system protein ImpD